jgi:hypothetical protein
MPTRLYRPAHARITLWDRLTAHPWSATVVGSVWTVFGVMLCWTWITPGGGPSRVIVTLPHYLAAGVSISLLVAGLLILTAVAWGGKDSTSWRIELVGLAPGIAAWLSYGLTSFSTGSPFFTTLGLAFALGGLLRIRAITQTWQRYASVTEQEPRPAEG